ncbi:hypothetical protein AOLI_G00176350 [Acnodon oligacanthus]
MSFRVVGLEEGGHIRTPKWPALKKRKSTGVTEGEGPWEGPREKSSCLPSEGQDGSGKLGGASSSFFILSHSPCNRACGTEKQTNKHTDQSPTERTQSM